MSLLDSLWNAMGYPLRRGMGHKGPRPSDKDAPIAELFLKLGAPAAVPTSGSTYSPLLLVKDQGQTESCVGQSVSNAVRAAYLALGQQCPDLSALFVYYGTRAIRTPRVSDDGGYLRDAESSLQVTGECDEVHWAFSEGRVNTPPAWSAYQNAIARRGKRRYYIINPGDVDSVKRALAAKVPVVGGWQVDDAFMDATIKGTQGPCKGKIVGGHAMMIESFDKDLFTNLNSWGKSYRLGGRYAASSDFIATANTLVAIDVRP